MYEQYIYIYIYYQIGGGIFVCISLHSKSQDADQKFMDEAAAPGGDCNQDGR